MLAFKHKVFCKYFLQTLDFSISCKEAKVNRNNMRALLYDEESEVSKHLRNEVDTYALVNSYITEDFIKYKLGLVVLNANSRQKIQAAKILLGYNEDVDKTAEFVALIKAMKEV